MSKVKEYTLTRERAASIIQVSTRTLDRYIRQNILTSLKIGAKVYLSDQEISNFIKFRKKTPLESTSNLKSKDKEPQKKNIYIKDLVGKHLERQKDPLEEKKEVLTSHDEYTVYQKLYHELAVQVKENQKRLEGANYKVGQLEAKLEIVNQHYISLADHHKYLNVLKVNEMELNTKNYQSKLLIKDIEDKFKNEKVNKQIIIAILFFLLLLQPIFWLILK
ncbi:hypothetical protein A2483_02940 [Candidatus Peregrinibacteria bacterium RIFOXYC2_FULL_33_13]|nr:MAG: hypothetical protein UR27_C0002G0030 [Candidatus Peregrinibacteria bacterium GW2011_GWA2_33_10]KKP41045.1 MAG: hypothetical protein UR30_C0002G0079 [Candidatus Peregrinibacteria bacterium GW2011_GWC2_33_13]OGJ50118.1 MAG: hypothetical protein A2229_03475 [Candidatus Peregrinibacteria bacterium RIFOXYA2_FULL_33_7]OGJ54411.1 MAG: hypothetical protein A2483_02940 [Candidatus Peregrinibacteria bacterium RIFOXYC2_FULL_33_13]